MQRKVIEVEIVSPNLDENEFQAVIREVKQTVKGFYGKKGNVAVDVYDSTNAIFNGGFSFGDKTETFKKDLTQPKCPNSPQGPGDWPRGIEWTCQANTNPPLNLCQVKKASSKNK